MTIKPLRLQKYLCSGMLWKADTKKLLTQKYFGAILLTRLNISSVNLRKKGCRLMDMNNIPANIKSSIGKFHEIMSALNSLKADTVHLEQWLNQTQ